MSTYPIVLMPKALLKAKEARPTIPSFYEQPPVAPTDPESQDNNTQFIFIGLAVVIALVFFFLFKNLVLATITFSSMCYYIFNEAPKQAQKTRAKREEEYQSKKLDYERKFSDYQHKKQKFEEEKLSKLASINLAEYQANLVKKILKQTVRHDGSGSQAKRGKMEATFYSKYLSVYFPGKIYTGLTLKNPEFENPDSYPYTPDFAYIDDSLNLCIDIEIDEPYDFTSKQPTHFLGADKDRKRNQFFLNRNWLVIRFCEKQIVTNPLGCCKTIAQVVTDITAVANMSDDLSMLNPFLNTPDVETILQWSQEDSTKMAAQNYRNNYR